MDTILFQQSQSIDELKNRLNCIEIGSFPDEMAGSGSGSGGSGSGSGGSGSGGSSQLILEQTKHSLLVDDEFVAGIVDNIMTIWLKSSNKLTQCKMKTRNCVNFFMPNKKQSMK